MTLHPTLLLSIGTLAYHDDSTSGKVTLKKMNLSCFKLCCDYSCWLNLTNVHDFPARAGVGGCKQAKPIERLYTRCDSKVESKTE